MDDSWIYILDKFRIVAPSNESLYYIHFLGIVVLILLFMWQLTLSKKRKRRTLAFEWNWFHKIAEMRDLSEEEADILVMLAQKFCPNNPQKLIQSVRFYDNTAKNFLESTLPDMEVYDNDELEELVDSVREKIFMKEFHSQDNLRSTRQIPPNQKIRVTVPTEKGKRFLHTVIAENTRTHITLRDDSFGTNAHLFIPQALFDGYYWRERDAGYRFPLIVVSKVIDNTATFKHSEEFSRKQRRHFFRIRTNFTGRFFIISDNDENFFMNHGTFPEDTPTDSFLGKVTNLSGGGVSFFTNKKLESDTVLRVELIVSKEQSFKGIMGRVIRADTIDEQYKVFVEFNTVHDKTRDAIIQMVSQIQMAKKSEKSS